MDDRDRNREPQGDQDLGTREATGSPSHGERMDEGMHQHAATSPTTIGTPRGLEEDVPGVGVHGAAQGEQDRPERGSEAQRLAQQSSDRAFPGGDEGSSSERDAG